MFLKPHLFNSYNTLWSTHYQTPYWKCHSRLLKRSEKLRLQLTSDNIVSALRRYKNSTEQVPDAHDKGNFLMSTNGDRRICIYQYVFSIRHLLLLLLSRYVNPRASGAKRRSGRKPGARVTNSA